MAAATLAPGQALFTVEVEIGRGGLGRVDRIRITDTNDAGKPVGSTWACKKLNPKWDQHPVMRQRFEREIRALQAMKHPNIVTCVGENLPGSSERFYAMPLYASNVRKLIAAGTMTADWRGVAQLGVVLADALHYAHGLGFIHRDLKPDNLLFNPKGPIIVADWGLGYFIHKHSVVLQQLTVGGMGTEYYCSLEQWNTGKCGPSGDVYSLAMTLDEWVTGQQRAIAVGMGIGSANTTADASAGARRFNALLRRMTNAVAVHRVASMDVVAAELRLALADQ